MTSYKNIYLKKQLIFIVLVILVVYAKTLFFNFVMLDDDIKIIDNYETISSPINITKAFFTDSYFQKEGLYYRPTLSLSLMFDAAIGGKNPYFYHQTNLLLHIFSCLLLMYFLGNFSKEQNPVEQTDSETFFKNTFNAQLLIVLFFGVNPLLINSVAWIPGRNDILLTIFILLSFWTFIRVIVTKKFIFILLHLIFFLISLFSKETALIFPVVFLLYLVLIKDSKLLTGTNIKLVFLWTAMILFYLCMRNNVVSINQGFESMYGDFIYNLSMIPELIGKFFIPYNFTGIPKYSLMNTIIGLIILSISIIIIILKKDKRKQLIFALLWVIITIIPGLFASRGATNFDYLECRAYLPMVGIVLFIYILIRNHRYSNNYYFKLLSVSIIVIYSIVNILYSSVYSNPLNFYNHAVEKNPNSAFALNNRALILKSLGKTQDAINDFKLAIKIDDKFAEVYFNYGNLANEIGNKHLAMELYNRGLKENPSAYKGYMIRGSLKEEKNDIDGAIIDFEKALEFDSTNFRAYFNIANILFQKGEVKKALNYYNKSIVYNNKYIQAFINRGVCFAHLGQYRKAIKDYNVVEKLDSNNDNLFYLRANSKFLMGDTTGACFDWYKSAELGNNNATRLISQFCR